MVWFTLWLAYDWIVIITDYLYLQPIQAKYQNEGIQPKNITVLKSGGPTTNLTSIIQYEVDITSLAMVGQLLGGGASGTNADVGSEGRIRSLCSSPVLIRAYAVTVSEYP